MVQTTDASDHAAWLLNWLSAGTAPPVSEMDERFGSEMIAARDLESWQEALDGTAAWMRGAVVVDIEVAHPYLTRRVLKTEAGPLLRMSCRASSSGSMTSLSFSAPFRTIAWTDHYLATEGGELRVRDYGGDGDPILLLHCGMSDVSHWDRPVRHLPGRRIALDLRGHGHWPASTGFAPSTVAADLATIIDAFGLEPPALVGHSLGGWTALACAASATVPISRIVTLDGPNRVGPPQGRPVPSDAPDWAAVHSCPEPLGAAQQFAAVAVPWLAVLCDTPDDNEGGRLEVARLLDQQPTVDVRWTSVAHMDLVNDQATLAAVSAFLT